MSRTLELPEPLYTALEEAAKESGTTPQGWIAAHLEPVVNATPARTLADRFEGRLGRIASGGREVLSEAAGETFSAYLEEKRRTGFL